MSVGPVYQYQPLLRNRKGELWRGQQKSQCFFDQRGMVAAPLVHIIHPSIPSSLPFIWY
jgi:hypothetical protein